MSKWSERKQEIEERRQFDLLCSRTKATENDLPDIIWSVDISCCAVLKVLIEPCRSLLSYEHLFYTSLMVFTLRSRNDLYREASQGFPFPFPSPPLSFFPRSQSLPSLPIPFEALGFRGWLGPLPQERASWWWSF